MRLFFKYAKFLQELIAMPEQHYERMTRTQFARRFDVSVRDFNKFTDLSERVEIIVLHEGAGGLITRERVLSWAARGHKPTKHRKDVWLTSTGYIYCFEIVGEFVNGDKFYLHTSDPYRLESFLNQCANAHGKRVPIRNIYGYGDYDYFFNAYGEWNYIHNMPEEEAAKESERARCEWEIQQRGPWIKVLTMFGVRNPEHCIGCGSPDGRELLVSSRGFVNFYRDGYYETEVGFYDPFAPEQYEMFSLRLDGKRW